MPDFDPAAIQVLAFDIFGTTVDRRTGVAEQVAQIAADQGVTLDGGEFADAWRDRPIPSMQRVRQRQRPCSSTRSRAIPCLCSYPCRSTNRRPFDRPESRKLAAQLLAGSRVVE
ncbi:hypothetical protein [Kibdelosporangium aridum]|uniref:hypothetical protein n=1 Tax=Kibdelosporangium aridum TaxID=2030 RepID=UPI0005262DF1